MCLNQKSYMWNHPLPSKPKIWKLYGACQNKIEHGASYSISKSHGYFEWLGQWFPACTVLMLMLQGPWACGKSGSFGSLCKSSVMQALMFPQNEVFTLVPVQWHSPKAQFGFMNSQITCQQSLLTLQTNRFLLYLVAGSSQLHSYFSDIKLMVLCCNNFEPVFHWEWLKYQGLLSSLFSSTSSPWDFWCMQLLYAC